MSPDTYINVPKGMSSVNALFAIYSATPNRRGGRRSEPVTNDRVKLIFTNYHLKIDILNRKTLGLDFTDFEEGRINVSKYLSNHPHQTAANLQEAVNKYAKLDPDSMLDKGNAFVLCRYDIHSKL